ncbi:MAG: hypothetical protein GF388_09420 [Candidatus Aegiribacteria sp.]|nr:hypothetical protein [Candidatus Aegiribacteria sp.]MBD3295274.1 hypothetical protein [Candidatus Fermentibacteria bacterium]
MEYRIDPEELIDVTLPLSSDTYCWPGDTPFSREIRFQNGFRTSRLIMSSHTGTHLDAPAHLRNLSSTIDEIPAEKLILPIRLISWNAGDRIPDDVSPEGSGMILKTEGAGTGLSLESAAAVLERGVSLVGIDAPSVEPADSFAVHRLLLEAEVPILENLDLKSVEPGRYLLLCFPLRILMGDGSPARVFLHPL